MKKYLKILICAMITASLLLVGCGSKTDENKGNEGTTPAKDKLKIACLINGNLGDKSFFDSAAKGIKEIETKYGYETKVIEMGFDKTKWNTTLEDVSEQDYDLIIVGTWDMKENLEEISARYPDKKYIIFDSSVDFAGGKCKNVYAIEYKQNEGSFLAGALAAMVTNSKMPLANADKKIGFIGGSDMPVINDFLVGYIEGAQYIDKGIKVAVSYVGNFDDSAKAKELALSQFNHGVDIGFNVAGKAGLGQIDAAKEAKKYVIGVDSDQAMLMKEKEPEKADLIPTSLLKRVDNSIVRAVELFKEGKLKFGETEVLGIKENAIEIVKNEYFDKLVSQEMKDKLNDIQKKLDAGEIKVKSALGMDTAELQKIKDSVK